MSNARETPTKYAFAAVSEGPSDAATESMRLLLQEEESGATKAWGMAMTRYLPSAAGRNA
ncbi:hypothetical protein HCH54_008295 [Aspergillus fumigatus]